MISCLLQQVNLRRLHKQMFAATENFNFAFTRHLCAQRHVCVRLRINDVHVAVAMMYMLQLQLNEHRANLETEVCVFVYERMCIYAYVCMYVHLRE